MIRLEGRCFVTEPDKMDWYVRGSWNEALVIGQRTGATAMSQWRVRVNADPSPVRSFADSDCVLFVLSGRGFVEVGPRRFALEPSCGVYVRPRESFRVVPIDKQVELLLTVCPQSDASAWLDEIGEEFDERHPERMVGVDQEKREQTGDRFFQLLVDQKVGSTQITQFIGMIPKSKAPSHHHLYEEAITVLSGQGKLWAGESSAPVGPGSMIYLPVGQEHSLQCESDQGMELIGHFYPAGSPAVAY